MPECAQWALLPCELFNRIVAFLVGATPYNRWCIVQLVCKSYSFSIDIKEHAVYLETNKPVISLGSEFETNVNTLPFDPSDEWEMFLAHNSVALSSIQCHMESLNKGPWCLADESVYMDVAHMVNSTIQSTGDLIDSFVQTTMVREDIEFHKIYRFYVSVPVTSASTNSKLRLDPTWNASTAPVGGDITLHSNLEFANVNIVIRVDFMLFQIWIIGSSIGKDVMIQFEEREDNLLMVDKAMNYMNLHVYDTGN